jgi:hypothetical protein
LRRRHASSSSSSREAKRPRGMGCPDAIERGVAVPPDDDTGGPSASTTAYRPRVVESACLLPRTAQAAKARSNGTVGFALSLLRVACSEPSIPQPVVALASASRSVGRSVTDRE